MRSGAGEHRQARSRDTTASLGPPSRATPSASWAATTEATAASWASTAGPSSDAAVATNSRDRRTAGRMQTQRVGDGGDEVAVAADGQTVRRRIMLDRIRSGGTLREREARRRGRRNVVVRMRDPNDGEAYARPEDSMRLPRGTGTDAGLIQPTHEQGVASYDCAALDRELVRLTHYWMPPDTAIHGSRADSDGREPEDVCSDDGSGSSSGGTSGAASPYGTPREGTPFGADADSELMFAATVAHGDAMRNEQQAAAGHEQHDAEGDGACGGRMVGVVPDATRADGGAQSNSSGQDGSVGAGAHTDQGRLAALRAAMEARAAASAQTAALSAGAADGRHDGNTDFTTWANERFGLRVNQVMPFEALQNLLYDRINEVSRLHAMMQESNMLNRDGDRSVERRAQIARLLEIITFAFYAIEGQRRVAHAVTLNMPSVFALETAVFRFQHIAQDIEDCQPNELLLLFVLRKLQAFGYRRYRGRCYRQISIKENADDPDSPLHATHAWEPAMSIREFIHRVVRKEMHRDIWRYSLKPGILRWLDEHLQGCYDPEFPELRPDRHVFAFRNGVYIANQVCFMRHGDAALPHDLVACKFFDLDFPEHLADVDVRWYEDIPTPAFQRIIDYQRMGATPEQRREVNAWLYVMLGRLLYEVNECDEWQVMAFIKGLAGSGKSIIAKVAAWFYDPSDVAAISSGGWDDKFGLSAVVDKFLFVCSEVKEHFGLNQGDLQSMISGEYVGLNIKFKTGETRLWVVPGLFMGNEVAAWIDAQGSMSRRIVLFEFPIKVLRPDPRLRAQVQSEMAHLLLKCNVAYRMATSLYSHRDIWDVLPKYFLDTQYRLRCQINPLVGFLCDDAVFERAPDRFVLHEAFLRRYTAWLKEHHFKPCRFVADHFNSVYEEFGLETVEDTRRWDGRERTAYWLVNIGFKTLDGHRPDEPSLFVPDLGGDADASGLLHHPGAQGDPSRPPARADDSPALPPKAPNLCGAGITSAMLDLSSIDREIWTAMDSLSLG